MLKKLYDNDFPRLKQLAYSMAGNECEDLVQDAFIKMIPYQHLCYSEAQALITTIVKNKCRDWLRHQKTVLRYMKAMPEPETSCEISLPFVAKEIRNQVKQLPAYTRAIIELRYFEEMTLREIGKIVGKDHATVYSQIKNGLQKLKMFQ
jgi:RNA polymerase sigma-70 factor, ECF subfamily